MRSHKPIVDLRGASNIHLLHWNLYHHPPPPHTNHSIQATHSKGGKQVSDGFAHPSCVSKAFPSLKLGDDATKLPGFKNLHKNDEKLMVRLVAGEALSKADFAHKMTRARSQSPARSPPAERARSASPLAEKKVSKSKGAKKVASE